jgi:hypothetical protein
MSSFAVKVVPITIEPHPKGDDTRRAILAGLRVTQLSHYEGAYPDLPDGEGAFRVHFEIKDLAQISPEIAKYLGGKTGDASIVVFGPDDMGKGGYEMDLPNATGFILDKPVKDSRSGLRQAEKYVREILSGKLPRGFQVS